MLKLYFRLILQAQSLQFPFILQIKLVLLFFYLFYFLIFLKFFIKFINTFFFFPCHSLVFLLNIFHHHLTNPRNFFSIFFWLRLLLHQMNILMVSINLIYKFFLKDFLFKTIHLFINLRKYLNQTIFFSLHLLIIYITVYLDFFFNK